MDFKTLLAVLVVHSHGFRVLHWKATGKNFDRIHNLTNDLYDMLGDDVDVIAEMMMRLDIDPVSFVEALKILEDGDDNYRIISSDSDYGYDEFVECTGVMLTDVLSCIEKVLGTDEMADPANVGIKASLESMHDKYDIQVRFLNKRRKD